MTLQPTANRDDVLYRGGSPALGQQMNFYRSMPKEGAKATTGSGSVTLAEDGANINAGSTTGDDALLQAGRVRRQGRGTGVAEFAVVMEHDPTLDNITSMAFVGRSDSNTNTVPNDSPNVCGIDLENTQFLVKKNGNVQDTVPLSTYPADFAQMTLYGKSDQSVDGGTGETVLKMFYDGEEFDSATISGTAAAFGPTLLHTRSNGTSEGFRVLSFYETIRPMRQ